MLRFSEFLIESKKKRPLHVFEDGEMTFGDIRNLIEDLFQKEIVTIKPKKPYATVGITCKDGKVCGYWNQDKPGEARAISNFASSYSGDKNYKVPFQTLLDSVEKSISDMDTEEQKEVFDDGHRFLKLDVYMPDNLTQCQNCGNSLIGVPNGQIHYDEKFENEVPLTEADEDISQRIISIFNTNVNNRTSKKANLDPLARSAYALKEEAVSAFRQCPNKKEVVNEVAKLLMELIDGLGYRATLNDYVKERYERKIMNAATKSGLNVRRSSEFVSEMVDRLSTMSSKRPTLSDLSTYAKREGVNVNSDEYKNFLELIEGTLEADNYEMLKPISVLLNKIFVLFLKNMLGYATMCDMKLANEITVVLDQLESAGEMTETNMTVLKKLMMKLREFAKTHQNGDKFTFTQNGSPYCLNCRCPDIEALSSKIMKA